MPTKLSCFKSGIIVGIALLSIVKVFSHFAIKSVFGTSVLVSGSFFENRSGNLSIVTPALSIGLLVPLSIANSVFTPVVINRTLRLIPSILSTAGSTFKKFTVLLNNSIKSSPVFTLGKSNG